MYFTCRDMVDESFADLTKIQGLRGIYIASQVTLSPGLIRVGPEHISSLITYDRGGEWKRLEAPMFDDDGQTIACVMVSMNSTSVERCDWRFYSIVHEDDGLLGCSVVSLVTHILQEFAASVIRVSRKCKFYHFSQKITLFGLLSSSSKTSVTKYRPTWHCIPDYSNLRSY